MTKYKAIKVRQEDHAVVAELVALVRQVGVGALPLPAQAALADGVNAGTLVVASLALLREQLSATKVRRK